MKSELTLRIILEQPPPGVTFGIQKGKSSVYETILKQQSDGGDLVFEFPIEVRDGQTGDPDFGGPIVQGPREGRFVYLDIGTYAGETGSPWQRRLKVPLSGITRQMLKAKLLQTRIPGTGRDGTPSCGTVRDFGGWKPAE